MKDKLKICMSWININWFVYVDLILFLYNLQNWTNLRIFFRNRVIINKDDYWVTKLYAPKLIMNESSVQKTMIENTNNEDTLDIYFRSKANVDGIASINSQSERSYSKYWNAWY